MSRGSEATRRWREKNPEHVREYARQWREKNREKANATVRRSYHGPDVDEWYAATLAAQGGCCAACGSDVPGARTIRFQIDHDHACCASNRSCPRCRRGLLCAQCNSAAGYAKDDPQVLRALADHIDRHHLRIVG